MGPMCSERPEKRLECRRVLKSVSKMGMYPDPRNGIYAVESCPSEVESCIKEGA